MPVSLDIFRGERVGVLGLARSGLAAAHALARGGAAVVCWDDSEAGRATAAAAGFEVADPAEPDVLDGAAALVPAPGVPLTHPAPHPAIARAKRLGVPILGDVELLGRAQPDARYLGVTGTNGKSTTTALIGHMLAAAGRNVAVGGNIGRAALALPPLDADGIYVLEVSSYQLDLIDRHAFDVAVLLNIAPDHLERHGGMAGYVAAKRRIFRNDKPASVAIVGRDDATSAAIADELAAAAAAGPAARRLIPVTGGGAASPGGAWVDADGRLIDDLEGAGERVLDLARCPALPGRHNAQNAAAAYAACRALGLTAAEAVAGLASFPGLPHRQERVATRDGITFVNDSKATNPEAAARALASYDRVYWIAGGRAKEGGFDSLTPQVGPVARALLIGEAAGALAEALAAAGVPVTRCAGLDAAVAEAFTLARSEESSGAETVILLSPACASFDQFKDFEARGDAFKAAVARLAGAESGVEADTGSGVGIGTEEAR